MAKNNNLTDFLTGVATAIRDVKGTSEPINPQNFESEIRSLGTRELTTGDIIPKFVVLIGLKQPEQEIPYLTITGGAWGNSQISLYGEPPGDCYNWENYTIGIDGWFSYIGSADIGNEGKMYSNFEGVTITYHNPEYIKIIPINF